MQEPFIGEIRLFAGSYAPRGWAFCDGQLLQVRDNTMLFSILQARYGGDGRTTFALPDLRGRTPLHPDPGTTPIMALGRQGGEREVTLSAEQLPRHAHEPRATRTPAGTQGLFGAVWGKASASLYSNRAPDAAMSANALDISGQGKPHQNRQPFLSLHFVIALQGVFPMKG